MASSLKAAAAQAFGTLFSHYAEFLVAGTYCRTGATPVAVKFLVMPVPADRVDGNEVLPNDEQLLLDAAELAAVNQPRPGDYVTQTSNGLKRDVVTAHLDVTGTLWTVVARKAF